MATWSEFAGHAPDLAAGGRRLIYQYGEPLAFLATVRRDGGPRLHPICPIIVDDCLYAFIAPSPKLNDLRRDGRYALHAFLPTDKDDEFYLTGRASPIDDPDRRATARAQCSWEVADNEQLFEFTVERALLAIYRAKGEFPPTYTRWADPSA